MTNRRERRPEALPLDPGVLRDGEVCEFQSELAVAAHGGIVVQPWRDRYLAAQSADLQVVYEAKEIPDQSFEQVVVHLQKSRAATSADLQHGWRILRPEGRLLLTGPNTLGIVSAVKRLAAQLDQTPVVVANRARARVVRFKKDSGPGPEIDETLSFSGHIESIHGDHFEFPIQTLPGVFSAKKLDAGSECLLDALPRYIGHKAPKRIVDLGCGTGVLGIAAATLWPEAKVLLADGDARAVECARLNVASLGLQGRCEVAWWDARENPVDTRFDLALVNPPFHQRGAEVEFGPALALFDSLREWLRPGRRALLVANRKLPYEAALEAIGDLEILNSTGAYKLLSLKRRARSSHSRRRTSPAPRSSGKKSWPT